MAPVALEPVLDHFVCFSDSIGTVLNSRTTNKEEKEDLRLQPRSVLDVLVLVQIVPPGREAGTHCVRPLCVPATNEWTVTASQDILPHLLLLCYSQA